MDSYLAESTRAPWRTTATIALTLALLVLAVGLTVRYRHDHRDEWSHAPIAWRGFDVSDDGRTLTFHGWGTGPCTAATGVSFSSDPTLGGNVVATLNTRTQRVRDGKTVFCFASLGLDLPIWSVTFEEPVPDGTIVTDGATSADAWDPFDCGAVTQVVRAPTSLGPSNGCGSAG